MRSYGLYFQFNNYNDEIKYFVDLYQQPWYRRLIAKAYSWYDMRIFKVPGFKAFERWHFNRFGGNYPLNYLPIGVRQDIRCFHLNKLDKEVLATLEVDEDTYIRLGGRPVREKT